MGIAFHSITAARRESERDRRRRHAKNEVSFVSHNVIYDCPPIEGLRVFASTLNHVVAPFGDPCALPPSPNRLVSAPPILESVLATVERAESKLKSTPEVSRPR